METIEVLSLEIRRRIYNYIQKNPGIHLRDLSRQLSIPKTTLLYHLRYLIKLDLIITKENAHFSRYYIAKKVGTREKNILGLIRQETPRKITLFLFLYPEHSRNDIAAETGKSSSTVSHHLTRLISLDVVERGRQSHRYIYRIHNQTEMYRILIQYEDSLSDDIVRHLLSWVRYVNPDGVPSTYRIRKKKDIDEIYEAILKIFPHPYHA
jgi:predicted transcriptional regulator